MNLLPLETFRGLFGINPIHFWGLSNSSWAAVTSACNTVTREHAWQETQAVGRQEIREAIETAEQRLREWLGYSVAPHYVTETLPWPRLAAYGSDGRWLSVQLREGYVQAVGSEILTRLATASVDYDDTDGDGKYDTYDITFTTTLDPDELVLYFSSTDRIDEDPIGERWRVVPTRVLPQDGTSVHFRGPLWHIVKPRLLEQPGSAQIDPEDINNYVGTLDVYRRQTGTPQATLTWETSPGAACCTSAGDHSADPAATATASARVAIRNGRLGIVAPAQATLDADTDVWHAVAWGLCRPPDSVTINYLAGVPLVNYQMDPAWRTIVARLAAAELAAPICACSTANRTLAYWQTDVARTGGNNDEQFGAVSQEDIGNPFGTRRGHIYAWKQVKHLAHTRGFLPG